MSDTASNLRAALALVETMPKRGNLEEVIRQSDQSAEDLLFATIELAHVLVGLHAGRGRNGRGDHREPRRHSRQANGRGLPADRGLIAISGVPHRGA